MAPSDAREVERPSGSEDALTVLFFASARDAARGARARVAGVTTVADLTERLCSQFGPELAMVLRTCAIWVNGEPSRPEDRLRAGDEVAVLPPVSGGCAAVPSK